MSADLLQLPGEGMNPSLRLQDIPDLTSMIHFLSALGLRLTVIPIATAHPGADPTLAKVGEGADSNVRNEEAQRQ